MALAMSLWGDYYSNMLWLDCIYTTDRDPSTPGAAHGECKVTSGVLADVEAHHPNAQVVFLNVKFGLIGSTFQQLA